MVLDWAITIRLPTTDALLILNASYVATEKGNKT